MATEGARSNWYTLDGSPFSRDRFTSVWVVALLSYGVGDIVTTMALAWFSRATMEANPLIAWAVTNVGGGGYLGLKLLAFYAALGISLWGGVRDTDSLLFYGPPVALAIVGLMITLSNTVLFV